ncbi:MAG: NAD(P)H-binding protein [Deltaproteobacteria bacterium]|nr:NAD(P)H-binding protein [Deltaproteobacteria bacterium]
MVRGDLNHPESIKTALTGREVLINVASLGFGHAAGLVEACVQAGVGRAIFISTTAIFTTLPAVSKSIRVEAERIITASRLDYTILRPTMIYGKPGDRNMIRLLHWLKWVPVVLIPGNGNFLMQPVFVEDVAAAAAGCLEHDLTIGRCYNISGQAPQTFNAIVTEAAQALGRRARLVHLPLAPCLALLQLYQRISPAPRLKPEQVLRLNEDKAFDHQDAARDFGFSPRSFTAGISREAALMEKQHG